MDIAQGIAETASTTSDPIDRALRAVREHLGMEVAYLSRFDGDMSEFTNVCAPGKEHLIKPRDRVPLDGIYCKHILEGRMPNLIPDTAKDPIAQSLPITSQGPIGAHVSVPILLPDGEPYGMFCCLSSTPNATLNERDLGVLRAIADMAGHHVLRDVADARARARVRATIQAVMNNDLLDIHYQPLWQIDDPTPTGFEALSRFTADPRRSPDKWFADAAHAGLALTLETYAIRRAITALGTLPAPVYVSINASPEVILSGTLDQVLRGHPLDRITLEVTEHAGFDDYCVSTFC